MAIKLGCQTYTWQMSGGKFDGRLDHILGVVARAGFAGVEPETRFLGPLRDPARLADALAAAQVALPAIALVEDWSQRGETESERTNADDCIALLRSFPAALLNLCPLPGIDRLHLKARQRNIVANVNAVARRAGDLGIRVGVHPNSFEGSVFRDANDYAILFDGLDTRVAGYIPDAGHIARGGMDPLSVIRAHRSIIVHVHFKDMTAGGAWAPMGGGVLDFTGITRFLAESNFTGWIVVEDECEEAVNHPDGVVVADGQYVRDVLLPLTSPGEQAMPCLS